MGSLPDVRDTLVLCYHALSEDWDAALSVTPARFERQIARLSRRGYRGLTVSQALSAEAGRVVAVTFDDAYRSVLDFAEPILARHGFVATVFAPTEFVGSQGPMSWPGIDGWLGGPHEPELVPLSWDQLGWLRDRGWEIGSHTVTHPRLSELEPADLARELADSKSACERALGGICRSVAYPYGDHDPGVIAAARAAGYEFGFTLSARLHRSYPLRWPRIGVYFDDGDGRFAVKTSRLVRRGRAFLDRGS